MALTEDQHKTLEFLSTTHRALHKDRMVRSFRIVVTTLTFYTLCVAAVLSNKLQFPTFSSFNCLVWLFFLIIGFFVAWDSYASGRSNDWNQKAAQAAEDALVAELGSLYVKPISANPRRFAWLWEVVLVIIAALVAATFVTSSN